MFYTQDLIKAQQQLTKFKSINENFINLCYITL